MMARWTSGGVGAAIVMATAWSARAETTAATAAELVELLRAQGVELAGVSINEDGSVTVRTAEEEAAAVEPEDDADEPEAPPEHAARAAPPPAPERAAEWESSLNVGLALSSGNSESANLAAEFESTRTSTRSELTFDVAYYYAENDGDESENRLTAGVNHDWLLDPSRWIFFAGGRADVDEFQDWEWRANANGGVGYRLIRNGDVTLTVRAGAGIVREFGGGSREVQPEGLVGADFTWRITERQSFEATVRAFPSFDDFGEFRARNTADYTIQLDDGSPLSLTFSLIHDYQSEVEGDTEENDFKLFAGLAYTF